MNQKADKSSLSAEATQQAEALLPTEWGEFIVSAHTDDKGDYTPHIVLRHPEMKTDAPVLVRVHSECITGDIFHSQKCDCGAQLHESMRLISADRGLLIYLRQEGRGIGIINKLKAYKHQEDGMDTIQANEALGLESDYRSYDIAAAILKKIGVSKVKLITNNPEKISGLGKSGIEVVERVSLIIPATDSSAAYLETKEKMMGHLLSDKG
jgi:GTP cyclohydrolase II